MRYLIAVITILMCVKDIRSQTYEIGPYIGGANYIGDVGSTSYIAPKSLLAGGIFKWNRSKRHSFRLSILHTSLEADDKNSDENRRQQRGYSFKNEITEASLGIEYTFWEWNLHNLKPQLTPYLYTGLTGVFTDNQYVDRTNRIVPGDNKITAAIPMVIGVKGTLNTNWVLGIEAGARYTFTDNLDGSNPEEFDGGEVYPSFGNPNTNDWYMFVGVTLTYTFGRKPCYCAF
ncbi:hypothetical protein LX95_01351 [Mesonia algae]|uniref:DUF6089 domain-containing protein n=1 Tax=Mesonia algae TaxID=213248 RepID=A0A2W7I608_9FLAO|nr:DUF6089 family protein [Mesonia algae]PZW41669.1 hypothetical protein LX95_01351 [Mesonia algae]